MSMLLEFDFASAADIESMVEALSDDSLPEETTFIARNKRLTAGGKPPLFAMASIPFRTSAERRSFARGLDLCRDLIGSECDDGKDVAPETAEQN